MRSATIGPQQPSTHRETRPGCPTISASTPTWVAWPRSGGSFAKKPKPSTRTVECLDDLVQAVDEASTNVIVHGYRGRPGWLEVEVALEDEQFVVTLEDAAPAVRPDGRAEPDLSSRPSSRRPGGMGVHLMRAATDGSAIDRDRVAATY